MINLFIFGHMVVSYFLLLQQNTIQDRYLFNDYRLLNQCRVTKSVFAIICVYVIHSIRCSSMASQSATNMEVDKQDKKRKKGDVSSDFETSGHERYLSILEFDSGKV